MKIGYVPYLPDLSQPGDRRRFPYFAKRYAIGFEIADPTKDYDVVLLTAPSNLTKWMAYKKAHPRTRFIFEMVDSLVYRINTFTTLFKGAGRYAMGREDRLIWNYKRILDEWIEVADLVLCSNKTLLEYVAGKNKNCLLSPDYLESEYRVRKENFAIKGKMQLVWEGQPSVLVHFSGFKPLLKRLKGFCELHVISTPEYPAIPLIYHRSTESFLKTLPIVTHFHEWNSKTNSRILAEADCAIIPIDRKYQLAWYKPANKLVSFWFTGLPTVTTATPAYESLMKEAGNSLYCLSDQEWVDRLRHLYEMREAERKDLSEQNFQFAKNNFSDSVLDEIWLQAFERLGMQFAVR